MNHYRYSFHCINLHASIHANDHINRIIYVIQSIRINSIFLINYVQLNSLCCFFFSTFIYNIIFSSSSSSPSSINDTKNKIHYYFLFFLFHSHRRFVSFLFHFMNRIRKTNSVVKHFIHHDLAILSIRSFLRWMFLFNTKIAFISVWFVCFSFILLVPFYFRYP